MLYVPRVLVFVSGFLLLCLALLNFQVELPCYTSKQNLASCCLQPFKSPCVPALSTPHKASFLDATKAFPGLCVYATPDQING